MELKAQPGHDVNVMSYELIGLNTRSLSNHGNTAVPWVSKTGR
jgi:hypothetical protein